MRAGVFGFYLFASALVLFAGGPVQAGETIGQVTRTQGHAMAIAGGENRTLAQGAIVARDDTLVTLQDSRLELRLADYTVLTLGENATLRIGALVFNVAQTPNRLAVFAEGAFRMITGKVNKIAGASVQVNTPVAVLSVRGTDFWSGPIDGIYGVLLLDGEVHVRTDGGETTLSEPGTGTNITDAASAPGPVTIWPQDKVNRALAAVSFR